MVDRSLFIAKRPTARPANQRAGGKFGVLAKNKNIAIALDPVNLMRKAGGTGAGVGMEQEVIGVNADFDLIQVVKTAA